MFACCFVEICWIMPILRSYKIINLVGNNDVFRWKLLTFSFKFSHDNLPQYFISIYTHMPDTHTHDTRRKPILRPLRTRRQRIITLYDTYQTSLTTENLHSILIVTSPADVQGFLLQRLELIHFSPLQSTRWFSKYFDLTIALATHARKLTSKKSSFREDYL